MNFAKDCTDFVPAVSAEDYFYELPPERIALYPQAERDKSRLLVADIPAETIGHRVFRDIAGLLPDGALMVMNNTRVITARLLMNKSTGGAAEVLCLAPTTPGPDPALALQSGSPVRWRCMVGGRRIRSGAVLKLDISGGEGQPPFVLHARIADRSGAESDVEFAWEPADLPFAVVLDRAGVLPLPPYIKRSAEAGDSLRYQTVYAEQPGSVAAPTAGLHFTDRVLQSLHDRGVRIERVTLHVGAGTFQPLQSDDVAQHRMHREYISVARAAVETMHAQAVRRSGSSSSAAPVIPVGTTSVRTLESLYWFGVRLLVGDGAARQEPELVVDQWDPYRLAEPASGIPAEQALEAVLAWMDTHDTDVITGGTRIMIVPGYRFALCDALVTNFHQPNSTLILLVAAFTGKKLWRRIYGEALRNDYRFLSYGDSSLLLNLRP